VVVWEIITQKEPWAGVAPVEVAIGVVTEGMRLPKVDTLPWIEETIDCKLDHILEGNQ